MRGRELGEGGRGGRQGGREAGRWLREGCQEVGEVERCGREEG